MLLKRSILFFSNDGIDTAFDVVRQRSGSWFDPGIVRAVKELKKDDALWSQLKAEESARELALSLELPESGVEANEATLDNICSAFAEIVDAKSHFTYQHSTGVATAAVGISQKLGLPQSMIAMIRRAALLHDIGKLSLSNAILDKPGSLSPREWEAVRLHPYDT